MYSAIDKKVLLSGSDRLHILYRKSSLPGRHGHCAAADNTVMLSRLRAICGSCNLTA